MFQSDYTETMSTLLDDTGRQQNDVLPRERLEADVAQFLKRQNELSTADKIEKSEIQNVDREIDAMLILERSSEYEGIDDTEKEEVNIVERMTDEFKSKA